MADTYVIGKELQRHIDAIKKSDGTAKKAIFDIAYRLSVIADPEFNLLDGTGYNNIVELAADQFGYARSTTLNYVKIANRYLEGNNKEVRTICADLDDGGKATADYRVGQLNALPGNVDRDEFRRLDAAGIINKNMSADTIKTTLKDYYNPEPEPETEPDPDPDDTGDSTEQGEQEQIPCLTLPICQIFTNIVTPIIESGDYVGESNARRAEMIFNEFFHDLYCMAWTSDSEDGEIYGARMFDAAGNLIYSTNDAIN